MQNFAGAVLPEWLTGPGAWFADAAEVFATPDLRADKEGIASLFAKGDDDGETLGAFALSGNSLELLSPARRPLWRQYRAILQIMEITLLQRLREGHLRAYGARIGADFEWIRPSDWWDLAPDPARRNVVHAGDVVYRFVRVVDPMMAPATFTPTPHQPTAQAQSPLAAPPSDIAATTNGTTIYTTGAPGRPTSMHLIEAELRRRAANGMMEMKSCSAEARALADWLRREHPEAAATQPKTIQNSIASLYRELSRKGIPK